MYTWPLHGPSNLVNITHECHTTETPFYRRAQNTAKFPACNVPQHHSLMSRWKTQASLGEHSRNIVQPAIVNHDELIPEASDLMQEMHRCKGDGSCLHHPSSTHASYLTS